jgi:hypothetical protein
MGDAAAGSFGGMTGAKGDRSLKLRHKRLDI